MTLSELLSALCAARIEIGRDGDTLALNLESELVPNVRSALLAHKPTLLGILVDGEAPALPVREWFWRTLHTYQSDDLTPAEPWHPAGAFWWRWRGETEWRAVPGRAGEQLPPLTSPEQYRNWTPWSTAEFDRERNGN